VTDVEKRTPVRDFVASPQSIIVGNDGMMDDLETIDEDGDAGVVASVDDVVAAVELDNEGLLSHDVDTASLL